MMEYVQEQIRTPVADEFDVIVVGGGAAGAVAAVSAARQNAKTLLLEKYNCLGGMWTVGMVNPLFDAEKKSGILREVIEELQRREAWGGFWNISFQYEYMKKILEDKCAEAGVRILYDTHFSKAVTDGNRVRGVIAENVSGRQAYLSKVVIDCTGDAAVVADAGGDFVLGGNNGECQAATLMFLVGNLPENLLDGRMLYDKIKPIFEKKHLKIPFTVPYLIPAPNSRYGVIQYTHMRKVNPLSAADCSAACAEGRRQMLELMEALREADEDFREVDLLMSAPILGIRESRRIVGDYTISTEDILQGTNFPDGIVSPTFGVDIHCEEADGQNCYQTGAYQIPYRSLIPKGLEGILVAGKAISGSHEAMASYRVTGNCAAMGEVAGAAAAQAAREGISVRQVEARQLTDVR